MNNESIKSIKSAIKAVAKYLELSDYKRRQIAKTEIDSPAGWLSYPENDNSEDACIQRYYDTIESIYSHNDGREAFHTNLFVDFRERMLRRYGIYA